MQKKHYMSFHSLEAILSKLNSFQQQCCLFSGCTDVGVMLRNGLIKAELLLDCKNIPDLYGIEINNSHLIIKANESFSRISNNSLIKKIFPLLANASLSVGSPAIRNRATLAGNINTASPAGDGLIVAYGLEAKIELKSINSSRLVRIDHYISKTKTTDRRDDELITAIHFPLKQWTFQKFFKIGKRNALAISVVNGIVALQLDKNKMIEDVRIALGAVAPTPIRVKEAELFLKGKTLSMELANNIDNIIRSKISPITDIRASANYRKYISGVLVKRQLLDALEGQ